jgi:hypothetical protein
MLEPDKTHLAVPFDCVDVFKSNKSNKAAIVHSPCNPCANTLTYHEGSGLKGLRQKSCPCVCGFYLKQTYNYLNYRDVCVKGSMT